MAMRADLAAVHAHLRRPPPEGLDPITAMRAMVEDYGMGCAGPGLDACRVQPVQIGDLAALWLVPPGAGDAHAGDARIVYLHGGGWLAGSPASHRAIAAELAHRTGQAVLLPDYRLAPEHPFPAALIDAAAALVHTASHGPDKAGPARCLSLAGDSAGGNLAAVLAMGLAPVAALPPIDRLLLICPFLAVACVEAGFIGAADDPSVSPEAMAMVAGLYAPGIAAHDPRISPLHADATMLARLPPTLVQVSAAETLRGQALLFTQQLWAHQNWARLSLWPDMPHVWHAFIGGLPEASAALEEAALFLKA